MQAPDNDPRATLDLWDYRRRVADLYGRVRTMEPVSAWELWVSTRDDLFASHPQSPLPPEGRNTFSGLDYWDYDPAMRVMAAVQPAPLDRIPIPHSGAGSTLARVFGRARFRLGGIEMALEMYWLDEYGGGVLVPFGDETNGAATYGGGRYLLDTAKGADLGHDSRQVTLDFNFAYHPSCVHDPRWSCPLPPPANRLPTRITAGERLRRGT